MGGLIASYHRYEGSSPSASRWGVPLSVQSSRSVRIPERGCWCCSRG